MAVISCAYCSKPLTTTPQRRKFCSRRCGNNAANRTLRQRKLAEKRKNSHAPCLFCNQDFIKKRFDQIYCSPECCRAKYRTIYPILECAVCHSNFTPIKAYQIYCSYLCKYRSHNAKRKIVRDPIECLHCKKLFVPVSNLNTYCSKRCAEPLADNPARPCSFCKGVFKPTRSDNVVCSKRCWSKMRNKNIPPINCIICGTLFLPVKEVNKCCSNDCRIKNSNNRRSGNGRAEQVGLSA
jgi:predicted nucleic acid-binding Zn ribbon protein